MLNSAMV